MGFWRVISHSSFLTPHSSLLTILLLLLIAVLPAAASDVIISYYYRPEREEIPNRLYVGWEAECGGYSIRLLQDPVITKSNNYLVADNETMYLVLRVAITNKTDEMGGWLASGSFRLQDTYLGRYYGSYGLDIAESAKVASGFHQQVFYSEIRPKDTLYTSLVFSVYPDVDSWVMTFAPHYFGSEPEESVQFRIPPAVIEDPATGNYYNHWDWRQNLK